MNNKDMIQVLQIVMFYRDHLTDEEVSSFGFDHELIRIGKRVYGGLAMEQIPQEKYHA